MSDSGHILDSNRSVIEVRFLAALQIGEYEESLAWPTA